MIGKELIGFLMEVKEFASLSEYGHKMADLCINELKNCSNDNIRDIEFHETVPYGNGIVRHRFIRDNVPENYKNIVTKIKIFLFNHGIYNAHLAGFMPAVHELLGWEDKKRIFFYAFSERESVEEEKDGVIVKNLCLNTEVGTDISFFRFID